MWRASRIAVIAASLALAYTPPPVHAQTAPLFDRLLSEYTAGHHDVVERTIKTQADLNALQPELNTALTTPPADVTRVGALFLLEIAAVTTEQKWIVTAVKGAPPFLEQVGFVWMRGVPLGSSPRADAFGILFHKAVIALMERSVSDTAKPIDDYLDAIQDRFDHSPLATPERRVLDLRFNLARAMGPELASLQPRSRYSLADTYDAGAVAMRFRKAMAAPDALPETFVRDAVVKLRDGAPKDALAALDLFKDPQDDPALTYWAWLFRGRALAALDRPAEADAAYRQALDACPHAQSAAVALTSLYLFWNNPTEAQRWSAEATTAPAGTNDPWWWYAQGDYRFLRGWLTSLREGAR